MNLIIFSLAFVVITLSGSAIADTVTTPAPSSTTASKSTYDWTGVYVGGFVGGATGAKTTTTEPYGGTLPSHYWNTPYGKSYSYDTKDAFL